MIRARLLSCLSASILLLLPVSAAQALTISFDLDYEFSGATAPAGPSPWMTVTFDDSFGGANTVRLTIDNVGLVGTESATGIYLNFDPALDATLLSFTAVDNSDSVPNAINTGTDAFMADGDGFFDIQFDMPPAPGAFGPRFSAGESIVYDLTYTSAITASSFDYFSVMGGGTGTYQAAAHVQSIGLAGEDSGWIGPVPEPSTGTLLGLGLLLAVRRRSRS
jgi:hypothetical protein